MAGVEHTSSSSSDTEDTSLHASLEQSTIRNNHCDELLQKRKCELMNELKRLQQTDRPVTGSESRQRVNTFFSRHLEQSENSIPVANIDNVEEHRPEQVVIEVQGLLQRRSVSSVLQSSSFRQSLERIVRGHLNNNSQERPRQEQSVHTSTENVDSSTVSSSSSTSYHTNTNRSVESEDVQQEPTSAERISAYMSQAHHDDLVYEISELFHRQLVSHTLSGSFRNILENHVLLQQHATGADGERVQNAILNLPASNIRRNDFSRWGLPAANNNAADLDDAVSVVSATATATIPYAQSNAAVNRELNAMKTQIAELTHMLKRSMELQVDIQRSIRQEVAAAIHQSTAADVPVSHTQFCNRRAAESKCLICFDENADAVLYRCGHICMCYACALRLKSARGTCPVCRASIVDIIRGYRISQE